MYYNIVLLLILELKLTRRLQYYYNTIYTYTLQVVIREKLCADSIIWRCLVTYFICNIQQFCDVNIRYVRSNDRVVTIHLSISLYTYIHYIIFLSNGTSRKILLVLYTIYILFIIHV